MDVTSNAGQISADLGRVGYRATRRLATVIAEAGEDLADAWADNARETAGAHGVHYPESIHSRMASPLTAEIGPREGMQQAGMSFEFGSTNQPPHLDGQRALDSLARRIERRIDIAVMDALD